MNTKRKSNTTKAATKKKPATASTAKIPAIKSTDDIFRQMEIFASKISKRAYELFEGRGGHPGHDIEDWLQAESELFKKPSVEVSSTGNNIIIKADVKGYKADDLQVGIESNYVIIYGAKRSSSKSKKGDGFTAEAYSEVLSRVIDLPGNVNTDKAKAKLERGILRIEAPRA